MGVETYLQIVTRYGTQPLCIELRRMINAGYVGRNRAAVQAHIDELAAEGVPAPAEIPMIFPVAARNLTTGAEIEVVGGKTSGEVEFVLLIEEGKVYTGVGSDHTDREVESFSIVKSKQVCPNVLATQVWEYDEIEPGWDDLVISSWVRPAPGQAEVLYQQDTLGSIISGSELLKLVRAKISDGRLQGTAIFSGTVPVIGGGMIYGSRFRFELHDPRLQRSIGAEYRIRNLDFLAETTESGR